MSNFSKLLIKKYFQENSLVESDIESFNNFVEKDIQEIINERKEVEPTIIPHDIEEFKIRFNKIWISKPEIIEADGSKRSIYPVEARLRNITYSAPVFLDISAHIDGVQRESFTTQIGSLPIMLHSKYCNLHNLSQKELIEKGEDPNDPGGYFIMNGIERLLTSSEELAQNKVNVNKEKTGISQYTAKLFSERGSFKIPHTLERLKDGIFYLSFTRIKRIPLIVIIKALGMLKDEEIMKLISEGKEYDSLYINLLEFANIKTEEEALDYIAKKTGSTQAKDIRIERMTEIMDRFLLPHIGTDKKDRIYKAYNLCKIARKFIAVENKEVIEDDKDHYKNKRLKMSGDLLADLFRVHFLALVGDMLYNFQRIVKRGKFPSIRVVIRDKLLTQRIYSAMSTGNWPGGRKGVSQRIQRHNFLDTLSHLQRVISPLSSSQENFAARALHTTHLGRLCPIETPEGTNIGLRKNLALMAKISKEDNEEELLKNLKNLGVKIK